MVQSQNIPMIRNGNQAIAFMSGKEVSKYFSGAMDNASLHTWYNQNPMENHLGLMNFWNQQTTERPVTLFDNLVEKKNIIEVNGWGASFTYDVPAEKDYGCYVEEDGSDQQYAGVDGAIFYVTLSKEFAPGTVLTYDLMDGEQFIVAEEEEVVPTGTGFKHPVKLSELSKGTWFPASKLGKGVEYFDVSHATPEYGTKFAKVQMPDTPDSHRFEFRLGSTQGVESMVTAMADSFSLRDGVLATSTKAYKDKIQNEMYQKGYGEFAVRMNVDGAGRPNFNSANVGSTMEYLTKKYLHKLTGSKLMFQRAAEFNSTNGVIRLNEGLWHQIRRGRIIEYGRPGGITKYHIAEAAEYVFRGTEILHKDRYLKFKCGTQAYYNVMDIFEDEVRAQLNRIGILLGADRVLPNSPVRAKDNDLSQLILDNVSFTQVYLPQIGNVDIEWDPSLDRGAKMDRFAGGMHPNGADWTTYSMMIWDASSSEYSNRAEGLPENTSLAEGGNANSNIFLVKPEGDPLMYSGRRNGRYDSTKSSDIVAAGKYMAEEYFAYNNLDVWVKDPSKFVTIELKKSARKGFN